MIETLPHPFPFSISCRYCNPFLLYRVLATMYCPFSPSPAIIYCLSEPSLTVTEEAGIVEFTATRTGAVGQADCIRVIVMDITTQGKSPL